jgi:hypothetical protein
MRENNCGAVSSDPLVLALGSTPATSNNPTAKLLRLSIRHVKLTRPTSSIRKSDSIVAPRPSGISTPDIETRIVFFAIIYRLS